MRLGRVRVLKAEERTAYAVLWPEVLDFREREGWHPPMTDYEVVANKGDLPDWIEDKYEILRRLDPENVGISEPPLGRPVIRKPRRNPEGLATGIVSAKWAATLTEMPPGYLWQTYWQGAHYSVDVVVYEGVVQWTVWSQGLSAEGRDRFGQFAAWVVYPAPPPVAVRPQLHPIMPAWFTGVVNVEFIRSAEGKIGIVEVHYRPSRCFGPLYGPTLRKAILDVLAGDLPSSHPQPRGGTFVPRPVNPPSVTVTAEMVDDDPSGWRAGGEFYL